MTGAPIRSVGNAFLMAAPCDPFTTLRNLAMEASWLYKETSLYQQIKIHTLKSTLYKYIESGRLCFRKDRPIYVDVGLPEKTIRVIDTYDPLWIAIGIYSKRQGSCCWVASKS